MIRLATRSSTALLILAAAAVLIAACATVPVTGRKQLDLLPSSQVLGMSYQQYDEFLAQHELSSDPGQVAMIQRVGHGIQTAVESFLAEKGLSSRLSGYSWEFNLVDDPQANAFCMPGGKVVFFTGILPICETEAGVAVVMGHEVAHAVAEHGSERMSQMLMTELGGMALETALENQPETTRQIAMTAFGVGAQFGALLPYSRLHESEADHLGMIFMAMAGYDPHEAASFWTRMAGAGGGQPPEFMSTHPSHQTRIDQINEHMDEAMSYYRP